MRNRYKRVRALLELKGMKLVDLALKLGMPTSTLAFYLNGYKPIPDELQERIAQVLEVKKEFLFSNDDSIMEAESWVKDLKG